MYYRLSILFFVIIICGMAACKQDYAVPAAPKDPPYLDVVNATADTVDYFINGTRQNNTSDIYPNGAGGYLAAYFGTANYSVKKAGLPATLFKQSLTLDTAKFYSYFICGESADKTFSITDDFSTATSTDSLSIANVRFVNASPDAGAVDIVVNNGSKVNLKNIAYKGVSKFYALQDTITEVKVYATGTTTPLVDTKFSLIGSKVYTIFTTGTVGGKNNAAFNAIMIPNTITID